MENCFFNPSWENPIDQNDPFESALSSMVSSPAASNAAAAPPGDTIMLGELIGRLGSISNSGENSPRFHSRSANNSCYSTPLNSPPRLSVMDYQIRMNPSPPILGSLNPSSAQFAAVPGFVERAARFSSFAASNFAHLGPNEQELVDLHKVSRVSGQRSVEISASRGGDGELRKLNELAASSVIENAEFSDSRENSCVSEQFAGGIGGQKGNNSRKRKSVSRGKAREANVASDKNEPNAKRTKQDEDKVKEGTNGSVKSEGDEGNKDNSKEAEPPKDYIHVRARRGQATDPHSLAERVRREKISERMKLLQDLVPGCNKVTGKAVMLDEIINYVQSLQRQVEFLSMKLATINPRMEESYASKESGGSLNHQFFALDNSASAFPFALQSQAGLNLHTALSKGSDIPFSMNHVNAAMGVNPNMQLPHLSNFHVTDPQASASFGNDLHGVVNKGLGQSRAQYFHGTVPTDRTKVEL